MATAGVLFVPTATEIAAARTRASIREVSSAVTITPPVCTVLSAMKALSLPRMVLKASAPPPLMARPPPALAATAMAVAVTLASIAASRVVVTITRPDSAWTGPRLPRPAPSMEASTALRS